MYYIEYCFDKLLKMVNNNINNNNKNNYIYIALQKFGNALEKWGFGQYWHESFLICDNFALIRDNTNYENIFYYINSLYIEKTYIFDSSKYPPLAAITALHNLGIRAVSLFKHWLWIGNQLLKLLKCADPKIFYKPGSSLNQ